MRSIGEQDRYLDAMIAGTPPGAVREHLIRARALPRGGCVSDHRLEFLAPERRHLVGVLAARLAAMRCVHIYDGGGETLCGIRAGGGFAPAGAGSPRTLCMADPAARCPVCLARLPASGIWIPPDVEPLLFATACNDQSAPMSGRPSEALFNKLATENPQALVVWCRRTDLPRGLIARAAEALGRVSDEGVAVPALMALLERDDLVVQEGALHGLACHPGHAVEARIRALIDDSHSHAAIREITAEVLDEFGYGVRASAWSRVGPRATSGASVTIANVRR